MLTMNRREERARRLTIFLLATPAAAICWFVFHALYEDLTAAEKAVASVAKSGGSFELMFRQAMGMLSK